MSKEVSNCDKCNVGLEERDTIWITSEDFEPLDDDNFSEKKCVKASKKYDCLCEDCYKEECCEEK